MLMLDATTLLQAMPYTQMVAELAHLHCEPIGLAEDLLLESTDTRENTNHFLIRTGWQPEKAVGAKVTTVFPRNNQARIKPSIQAVYVLFEGETGSPIACLDGTVLTWLKTAADSALASRLLSRQNCEAMLMIGAGQLAPHLIRAHCAVRPSLHSVAIYNRTLEKAQALCAQLQGELPGVNFDAISTLEMALREADLVCSAIGCEQPVVRGAWLKPGTHIDLVGSFTPNMREADDDCLRRGHLFVDARETTLHHVGELIQPLASGVIEEADVLADLADLCLERHPGRQSDHDITIFKNGGGGHLDLMCARILHRHCEAA